MGDPMSEPLDLWSIEQKLEEIMAKKKFPYCRVSAKARQEILYVLLEEFLPHIKNSIKKACKFYLKYKDKPDLLFESLDNSGDFDIPLKKKSELAEFIWLLKNSPLKDTEMILNEYNEWLFKLTFGLK